MKTKKGEKYQVINFTDYTSPKTVDEVGRKWVTWGQNNSFFDHLRDLYLNSSTNNICINGIVRLCYGKGLFFESQEMSKALSRAFKKRDLNRSMLQFYLYNKMAFQVEYEMDETGQKRTKGDNIKKIFMLPAKNIAPAKRNEDDEIDTYYYSENWKKRDTEKYRPVALPAYGYGTEEDEIEVYCYQVEQDENDYFSPVLYNGCLQFAECEIEQSNYHLNHLKNGFTTNAVVNFNSGDPGPEERDRITRAFIDTKTGSKNAGKPFITFNQGAENAVTISSYDIPDPHRQYEFIDTLSTEKIYTTHGITSPLLIGVRQSGGGLGSNAAEIKESYEVMKAMTLEPIREAFIEGLRPLLLKVGIAVEPKMVDLDIFETTNSNEREPASEEREAQLANTEFQKMLVSQKKKPKCDTRPKMTEEDEEDWLKVLENRGEVLDPEEWGIASVEEVQDVAVEEELHAIMVQYANTSPEDGRPQADSRQGDSGLYKIRYRYDGRIRQNSRKFCRFMVNRSQSGVVYRKEEIDQMEDDRINGSFAPKGRTKYSIWEWKGGVYCHHKWMRVVYFRRRNARGQFLPRSFDSAMNNDEVKSVQEAEEAGVPTNKLEPKDWEQANTRPIDTPTRGRLN